MKVQHLQKGGSWCDGEGVTENPLFRSLIKYNLICTLDLNDSIITNYDDLPRQGMQIINPFARGTCRSKYFLSI